MVFKDSFEILEYSQGNEIDEILIRGNYSSKLTEGLIVYIIDESGASYVTKINKVDQMQDKENTLLSVIHKQNIDSPKSVIVLGDPEGDLVLGCDLREPLHLGDGIDVDHDAEVCDLLQFLVADVHPGVHDPVGCESRLETGLDLSYGHGVDAGSLLLKDPQ